MAEPHHKHLLCKLSLLEEEMENNGPTVGGRREPPRPRRPERGSLDLVWSSLKASLTSTRTDGGHRIGARRDISGRRGSLRRTGSMRSFQLRKDTISIGLYCSSSTPLRR